MWYLVSRTTSCWLTSVWCCRPASRGFTCSHFLSPELVWVLLTQTHTAHTHTDIHTRLTFNLTEFKHTNLFRCVPLTATTQAKWTSKTLLVKIVSNPNLENNYGSISIMYDKLLIKNILKWVSKSKKLELLTISKASQSINVCTFVNPAISFLCLLPSACWDSLWVLHYPQQEWTGVETRCSRGRWGLICVCLLQCKAPCWFQTSCVSL